MVLDGDEGLEKKIEDPTCKRVLQVDQGKASKGLKKRSVRCSSAPALPGIRAVTSELRSHEPNLRQMRSRLWILGTYSI